MRWETNETTRPNGRWNYPAVGRTARLECFHCGHQVDDTPSNRRRLDDTHRYEASNPSADETIVGYRIPFVANVDRSFAKAVTKYLQAKDEQEQHGNILPLIEFYQKHLARAWNLNTAADFHRLAYEPYDVRSDWPEERFRAMTVDCQKDFQEFWYVIRAWSESGDSRQLARGRAESWEELVKIQESFQVPNRWVFIDCGYEATKVAEECVRHGDERMVGPKRMWLCWTALKGAGQDSFGHTDKKTGAKDRRIYSELGHLNPNVGKKRGAYLCPFYAWSNLHAKDILRRHRDGQARKFLSLPDAAPATDLFSYTAQMNSEIRVKERAESGKLVSIWKPIGKRPNHYWDCEAMQVVVACIFGVIGGYASEPETVPLAA